MLDKIILSPALPLGALAAAVIRLAQGDLVSALMCAVTAMLLLVIRMILQSVMRVTSLMGKETSVGLYRALSGLPQGAFRSPDGEVFYSVDRKQVLWMRLVAVSRTPVEQIKEAHSDLIGGMRASTFPLQIFTFAGQKASQHLMFMPIELDEHGQEVALKRVPAARLGARLRDLRLGARTGTHLVTDEEVQALTAELRVAQHDPLEES